MRGRSSPACEVMIERREAVESSKQAREEVKGSLVIALDAIVASNGQLGCLVELGNFG
jgi:hypothetical protein